MAGPLIVSVSGIHERTLPSALELAGWLDTCGVPLSLFVTPRLPGGRRLFDDRATVAWLRERRDRTDAIVLHGYHAEGPGGRPEFAALSRREADLRLVAADGLLEQLGLRTRLFAAPRWSLSGDALEALGRNGFRLSIELHGLRDLRDGGVVEPGRAWDVRSLDRRGWARHVLVHRVVRQTRSGRPVRLAVDADRAGRPEIRDAVREAVAAALDHGARPDVYRWRGDERRAVA